MLLCLSVPEEQATRSFGIWVQDLYNRPIEYMVAVGQQIWFLLPSSSIAELMQDLLTHNGTMTFWAREDRLLSEVGALRIWRNYGSWDRRCRPGQRRD